MLTNQREYDFVGLLNLRKSKVLNIECLPKDDIVNWLFLYIGIERFGFTYKIDMPLLAEYNKPFKVKIAFTMFELVKENIELNKSYLVSRGEEIIGEIILTESI